MSTDPMGDEVKHRVVVEVVTPEVVSRLEADNTLLRQEMKQLRDKHEALHRTVYRLMEKVSDMTRSSK